MFDPFKTKLEGKVGEIYNYDEKPDFIERLPNGRPDYPLTRNLRVPPECIGLEPPMASFVHHTSAQRLNMNTTILGQAMIVDGAEFPIVSSGYEREYLKYTFNATRFNQPSVILKVIPVYRTNRGSDPIKYNARWLLIYHGLTDNKIHSMWVCTYTKGTNGFGWDNIIDESYFNEGIEASKNDTVTHSRAVQG